MTVTKEVLLREYRQTDRAAVLTLHRELQAMEVALRPERSASPSLSEKYFEAEYDDLTADPECDSMFVVAEVEEKVVGYIFCLVESELLDEPSKQVYVMDIMVTEQARGIGVGKKLMTAMTGFAAQRNISRVSLMVLSKNENAVSFYRKLGFETSTLTMEMTI